MLESKESFMTKDLTYVEAIFITTMCAATSLLSPMLCLICREGNGLTSVCLPLSQASLHIGAKAEFFSLFRKFLSLFRTLMAECGHFDCCGDWLNTEFQR